MYSFDLDRGYGNERYHDMVRVANSKRITTQALSKGTKPGRHLLKKVSHQLLGLHVQLRSAEGV